MFGRKKNRKDVKKDSLVHHHHQHDGPPPSVSSSSTSAELDHEHQQQLHHSTTAGNATAKKPKLTVRQKLEAFFGSRQKDLPSFLAEKGHHVGSPSSSSSSSSASSFLHDGDGRPSSPSSPSAVRASSGGATASSGARASRQPSPAPALSPTFPRHAPSSPPPPLPAVSASSGFSSSTSSSSIPSPPPPPMSPPPLPASLGLPPLPAFGLPPPLQLGAEHAHALPRPRPLTQQLRPISPHTISPMPSASTMNVDSSAPSSMNAPPPAPPPPPAAMGRPPLQGVPAGPGPRPARASPREIPSSPASPFPALRPVRPQSAVHVTSASNPLQVSAPSAFRLPSLKPTGGKFQLKTATMPELVHQIEDETTEEVPPPPPPRSSGPRESTHSVMDPTSAGVDGGNLTESVRRAPSPPVPSPRGLPPPLPERSPRSPRPPLSHSSDDCHPQDRDASSLSPLPSPRRPVPPPPIRHDLTDGEPSQLSPRLPPAPPIRSPQPSPRPLHDSHPSFTPTPQDDASVPAEPSVGTSPDDPLELTSQDSREAPEAESDANETTLVPKDNDVNQDEALDPSTKTEDSQPQQFCAAASVPQTDYSEPSIDFFLDEEDVVSDRVDASPKASEEPEEEVESSNQHAVAESGDVEKMISVESSTPAPTPDMIDAWLASTNATQSDGLAATAPVTKSSSAEEERPPHVDTTEGHTTQERPDNEAPATNLLSAALSGSAAPASGALNHLTRGRPMAASNRKRPTNSRRAKALGITVGPQTKEVIEPPRSVENEEGGETSPNESKTTDGEDASRRADLRTRLAASRPLSSPNMADELRGALMARAQPPPGSPNAPLRLPPSARMSLPAIVLPEGRPSVEEEQNPGSPGKNQKGGDAEHATQVSPRRGIKSLLFGKKSPRKKSPRKGATMDTLVSPGRDSKSRRDGNTNPNVEKV